MAGDHVHFLRRHAPAELFANGAVRNAERLAILGMAAHDRGAVVCARLPSRDAEERAGRAVPGQDLSFHGNQEGRV